MNLDLRQLDRGPRWPGWRGLAPILAWGSLVAVVFLAVYPASNWLGSRRAELWHFYLDNELAIPFVPQAVWLYLSMYLLSALPPWFVPADAAARLGKQLLSGCVTCGSIFLLLVEKPHRRIRIKFLDQVVVWAGKDGRPSDGKRGSREPNLGFPVGEIIHRDLISPSRNALRYSSFSIRISWRAPGISSNRPCGRVWANLSAA